MARRKPLPYHASYSVDVAQMEISDATRQLVPLMNGEPIASEERYRRIGLAIHCLHRAAAALKEIRTANQPSTPA